MKLKGIISHEGMRALERSFLPALEKFGNRCFLLLTPEDFYLIQDTSEAGGMQTSARLDAVRIFIFGSRHSLLDALFFVCRRTSHHAHCNTCAEYYLRTWESSL